MMSALEASNDTSVSNAKRGRGRPKKQVNNGINNINDNVKNGNKLTKKRGRQGQPDNDNVADNDEDDATTGVTTGVAVDDGVSGTATTLTSSRSRLRNMPLTAIAAIKTKTATNNSVGKRGAKRSMNSAKTNPTTGGKRRGRGRPPKSQKAGKANVDAESTPDESNDEHIDED